MIYREHLRWLIKSTLNELGLYSESAENLIYGTISVESNRGTYLKQKGNGPALGIIQMEPATHSDLWKNYLAYKSDLVDKIKEMVGQDAMKHSALVYNLKYAIIMCRIHYLRIPAKIPNANNIQALAEYWKKYYNTSLGAGKVEDFIEKYNA